MFSITEWKKGEVWFTAGVLAFIFGISFYQVKLGEMKTRDAQRRTDAEMVARGLKQYFADYGVYPPEATGSGKIAACGYMGRETCEWGGGPVTDDLGVVYINKLPDDPWYERGYRYVYKVPADGKSFRIYVYLEHRSDKDYRDNLNEECGNGVRCGWYTE